MERRVTTKIDNHQVSFKNAIQEWINTHNCQVMCDGKNISGEFLTFVYEHPNLVITKEDFQKRKRVKNVVSHFERCSANRANGEQCTRRKKNDSCFCGTHAKGTPHGVNINTNVNTRNIKNIEVWVQEINGINYYIDSENNVYKHEDIVLNKSCPSVIAKWELLDDGNYIIPAYVSTKS